MKFRPFLRKFQQNTCPLCGRGMLLNTPPGGDRTNMSTRDHVQPRSCGGESNENILLAHKGCNEAKSNRLPYACEVMYALEARRAFVTASMAKIRARKLAKKLKLGRVP